MTKKRTDEFAQIAVISLQRAHARREFQERQLSEAGLDYELVNAFEPAHIRPSELMSRSLNWGRRLRETEVACLMSHRAVWQRIAEGRNAVLVLEDDAILSSDIALLLGRLRELSGIDCVNLETFNRPKLLSGKPVKLRDLDYQLFRLRHDRGGAAAYLLWPAGARKLLSFTKSFSPLADAAISLTPGLVRFQTFPAAAIQMMNYGAQQDEASATSASGGARPAFESISQVLRGRLLRLGCAALLATHRIAALPEVKPRLVPFKDTRI